MTKVHISPTSITRAMYLVTSTKHRLVGISVLIKQLWGTVCKLCTYQEHYHSISRKLNIFNKSKVKIWLTHLHFFIGSTWQRQILQNNLYKPWKIWIFLWEISRSIVKEEIKNIKRFEQGHKLSISIIFLKYISFAVRPLDVTSALTTNPFRIAPLHQLSPGAIVTAFFLGFSLSLLFFIDHNISSSYISDPYYK